MGYTHESDHSGVKMARVGVDHSLFKDMDVIDCCEYLNEIFPDHCGVLKEGGVKKRMVKAILLLDKTGEYRLVDIGSRDDYAHHIGGYIEEIDVARGYTNPDRKDLFVKRRVTCYANIEGNMPNPWTKVVNILRGHYTPLFGNILLMCQDETNGDDGDVDPYIVDLIKQYSVCTDEHTFLGVLYRQNNVERAGL